MSRKYLVLGNYTADGLAGAMKVGFESRFDAIVKAVTDLGGTLIEYSFCQGTYDFVILTEWEDESKAMLMPMVAMASGTVQSHSIRLMSAQEMDQTRSHLPELHWSAPEK